MENKMKMTFLSLITTVLCLAPIAARAEGYTDALLSEAIKIKAADRTDGVSSKCMNLKYVGSSTEAVVTIGVGAITAYAPAGTADSSNFGVSASSYALGSSAYDTMGELCDAVDALANYNCVLRGCDRSLNSKFLRDQTATSGTNDLKANGGFDVLLDSGTAGALTTPFDIRLGLNPKTGHRVILRTCKASSSAGTIQVQGKQRKYEGETDATRNDATVVYSAPIVAGTDLAIPPTILDAGWIEFGKGEHVVVSVGNGTLGQGSTNYLECQWFEKQ